MNCIRVSVLGTTSFASITQSVWHREKEDSGGSEKFKNWLTCVWRAVVVSKVDFERLELSKFRSSKLDVLI